jgi:hypothetical protein
MFPLAVSSGINLYGTILIVGLSIRYGLVTDVPQVFHILASPPVIIAAAVFYLLEFFADKVQFIDQIWDLIHTFVRPLGAAIIAFTAVGEVDPSMALIAAMISAGAALVSHSGKAGGRVVLNTASPAENISNIGISLAEDVLVGILAVLALKYPAIAAILAAIILLLIVIFIPRLVRWSWYNLVALVARVRGVVSPITQSEDLPANHASLLPHPADIALGCRVQGVKGIQGQSGFLALVKQDITFTYTGWIQHGTWGINQQDITSVALDTSGLLLDTLKIGYEDERGKDREATFVVTKDRQQLLAEVVQRLGSSPYTTYPATALS